MAATTTKENNNGTTKTEDKQPTFYENDENLKKLCDFLRSNEGPPVREALLMEKRVHYIKGAFKK